MTKKFIGSGILIIILLFVFVVIAVNRGWTNESGIIDHRFKPHSVPSHPLWARGEEWQVFKAAITKDAETLRRAAQTANLSPRLVMIQIAVEQLRLYHSEREIFKKVFSPLKILGDQIQFSWGIAGLKAETAKQIEEHLKNPDSDYYPGQEYERLLDFATTDPDQERFRRITNEQDHYWSYLYVALYLKEVLAQWSAAGVDISQRPEILSTLFNIGFANSQPKTNPQVGGAAIEINGATYSFGGLAYEIYYSDELIEEFPR